MVRLAGGGEHHELPLSAVRCEGRLHRGLHDGAQRATSARRTLLGGVSSVSGSAAEGLPRGKPPPHPGASGTAGAEVSCRKSRTRATRREEDGVSKKERRW